MTGSQTVRLLNIRFFRNGLNEVCFRTCICILFALNAFMIRTILKLCWQADIKNQIKIITILSTQKFAKFRQNLSDTENNDTFNVREFYHFFAAN